MIPSTHLLESALLRWVVWPAVRALALAALVGALAALARGRRFAVALRLRLWRIVLGAALAMPLLAAITPGVRWPVMTRAQAPTPPPIRSESRTRPVLHAATAAPLLPVVPTPGLSIDALPFQPPPAPPQVPLAPGMVLLALYVAGVAALLLRLVLGMWALGRLRRSARPLPPTESCWDASFLVAETTGLTVPVVVGWRAPLLLLPPCWRQWTPTQRAAVLAHEGAHVRGGDALWQRLALLHRALFWFSPLAWWLNARLAALSEEVSDQAVLDTGADPAAYAALLLEFFKSAAAGPRIAWPALGIAPRHRGIRRIEAVLAWRPAREVRRQGWLLLALAPVFAYGAAALHPAWVIRALPDAAKLPPAASPAPTPPLTAAPSSQLRNAARSARSACSVPLNAVGVPMFASACDNAGPAQFAWTRQYAGRSTDQLVADPQFQPLLQAMAPDAVYHLGLDRPLTEAMAILLRQDTPAPVRLRNDRYLTFGSRRFNAMEGAWVWIDLQRGSAFGAIVRHPTNGEPAPNLTVFSGQWNAGEFGEASLPTPLLDDLHAWLRQQRWPDPMARYLIDAAGRKRPWPHALAPCSAAADLAASLCRATQLDAANRDLQAMRYLLEHRYAAGSSARTRFNAGQADWAGAIDAACGPGPGFQNTACALQRTRAQVQALDAALDLPYP